MPELAAERAALQESMTFLGAIAGGLEQALGESANDISYLAGKRLGIKLSADAPRAADLESALETVRQLLVDNGCLWHFETFKPHDRVDLVEVTDAGENILLVFRDCMIRQSLFRFGHPQKGSLCRLMYGFFAGALYNILGEDSTLDIIHAGENACLKQLTIHRTRRQELAS